ncbi:uncharacterized protein LOC141720046 [Apium graveolens]|uniref:uncharacterized protein LOC141720046 n=1 Tax=Apium graveolens TaxID=4045 RepID=UPI003D7BC1A7
MKVQDHDVTFNVFNAMKFPTDEEECYKVELVDSVVNSELDQLLRSDTLERAITGESDSEDKGAEQLQFLNASPWNRKLDLPFELAGHEYYFLWDGYSGYNQIFIALEDQENTTFTCPFGTFAFRRVSFGLCGAPTTFQRCMMTIFFDMIGINVEVFMDYFSIFGSSYDECLHNLSLDVPFKFDEKCLAAFESFKRSLTTTPGITTPDWDEPFEMMCDACDFAVGAVLGQRKKNIFHVGADQIIRRCIPYSKTEGILRDCHATAYGGHYRGEKTVARILQAGFFWPTLFKDAHYFVLRCDRCQWVGNMSKRDEMPLNVLLEVEIFDVWGIDFMIPFISSCNNQYTLLAVDYVSKWVEVKALPTNNAKVVINFLHKHIVTYFGTSRVIISDEGSFFCNRISTALMERYRVYHRVATAYHLQTNGQAQVYNREIKQILEKVVSPSRMDWSLKLDEVVRAYRTTFKTSLGMSPFQLVYGKACHLPAELEYKVY